MPHDDEDPIDLAQRQPVCALDVAEKGSHTYEEVGALMGVTRERARQVQVLGEQKLRKKGFARKWRELGDAHLRSRTPGKMTIRDTRAEPTLSTDEVAMRWPQASPGARIALLRLQHGLTQDELAEASRLSRDTVARYEQGGTMTTSTLWSICHVFGVSPGALRRRTAPSRGFEWQTLSAPDRIALLRREAGLTVADMAARAGMTGGYLHRIERGSATSAQAHMRAAAALGLTLDDIEGDTMPTPKVE